MMKRILSIILVLMLLLTCFTGANAFADDSGTQTGTPGKIEITVDYNSHPYSAIGSQFRYYICANMENPDSEIKVSSSDTSFMTAELFRKHVRSENTVGLSLSYVIHKPGKGYIILECEGEKEQIPVCCYPEKKAEIKTIAVSGYEKVTLKWKKLEGVDGYSITRYSDWYSDFEDNIITTVYGADNTSAEVLAELNKPYYYRIAAFYSFNNGTRAHSYWSDPQIYECPVAGTNIKSVTAEKKSMTVRWEPTPGAVGYEVYRSGYEEDGYKKIASVSGKANSYSDKPKAGRVWHYAVRPVFSDGKGTIQNTYAQIKTCSKANKTFSVGNKKIRLGDDDFLQMFSDGDNLCYVAGKTTANSKGVIKLKEFRLGKNHKVKSSKTRNITAGKGASMNGFYHGPDGNNYFIVTFSNFKDKENKVVIKVLRYNSKWKRTGAASLKANSTILGISSSCVTGWPAIKMHGNKLLVHTSRYHFVSKSDGRRHESNLTFLVDLKTMKADDAGIGWAYTSHSWAQKLRFKDDRFYLADLGDGYPRGLHVSTADGALAKLDYDDQSEWNKDYVTFKFRGRNGQNDTGTSLDGMEISKNKIVICGTSVPHDHPLKGVKGFENRNYNLYVNVIDKNTGKAKVVWLTKYNPKKTGPSFGDVSMVKLSDNRFAILASIKGRLNYYVISDSGKIMKHIIYKKSVSFVPITEPFVSNGSIVWSEWNSAKEKDSGSDYIKVCGIPVVK